MRLLKKWPRQLVGMIRWLWTHVGASSNAAVVTCFTSHCFLAEVLFMSRPVYTAFLGLTCQNRRCSRSFIAMMFWQILIFIQKTLRSFYGALSPWMFVVTAPVHSLLNWCTVMFMPKMGVPAVESWRRISSSQSRLFLVSGVALGSQRCFLGNWSLPYMAMSKRSL